MLIIPLPNDEKVHSRTCFGQGNVRGSNTHLLRKRFEESLHDLSFSHFRPPWHKQCPRQRPLHPSASQLRARLAHSDPLIQLGLLQQVLEIVWLNQQTFIPPSSGGWQAHNQGASLLGVWWEFSVCRWLSSGCSLTWKAERDTERERKEGGSLVSSSPYKLTNSTTGVGPSWLHLNLVTSQRPTSKCHHLEIRGVNIWICVGETQTFSPRYLMNHCW